MDMNQFVKIGNKSFSVEEFCQRLGVDPVVGLPITIGQTALGGTMEASIVMGNPENCPSVDVNFCADGELPIYLSHTEQPGYKNDPLVRTYLYDRAESYVAYLDHKICPEEELGEEILGTKLIASGDGDVMVNVYRENQYVRWCGPMNNP